MKIRNSDDCMAWIYYLNSFLILLLLITSISIFIPRMKCISIQIDFEMPHFPWPSTCITYSWYNIWTRMYKSKSLWIGGRREVLKRSRGQPEQLIGCVERLHNAISQSIIPHQISDYDEWVVEYAAWFFIGTVDSDGPIIPSMLIDAWNLPNRWEGPII